MAFSVASAGAYTTLEVLSGAFGIPQGSSGDVSWAWLLRGLRTVNMAEPSSWFGQDLHSSVGEIFCLQILGA